MFENKKIFILGMARSGYEVAKVLSEHNNQITITDEKDQNPIHVKELLKLGINFIKTGTDRETIKKLTDENNELRFQIKDQKRKMKLMKTQIQDLQNKNSKGEKQGSDHKIIKLN